MYTSVQMLCLSQWKQFVIAALITWSTIDQQYEISHYRGVIGP